MADEKEYVKLWISYKTYFEAYSAAEVGRLVLAMIDYKSSGAEPEFSGSERFIWPAIRRDIDMATEAQNEKSQINRENGKRGGRPRKEGSGPAKEENGRFQENPKKANGFSENRKKQTVFLESEKRHGQGQGQGQGQGLSLRAGARETEPPTFEQVYAVAQMSGYPELARPFFDYYSAAQWRDSEGKPVRSWQQKLVAWRVREDDKIRKQIQRQNQTKGQSWAELAEEMDKEDGL